jgi:hypothetical protein
MQWSPGPNGGFSAAEVTQLPAPVVTGGFSPEYVNVEDQRRDERSLLRFVTLLAQRYRECPELGHGDYEVLDHPRREVLAHRVSWDGASMVALHNLGPEPCRVPLAFDDLPPGTELVDLLVDGRADVDDDGRVELLLEGYGFRWLRIAEPGSRRLL